MEKQNNNTTIGKNTISVLLVEPKRFPKVVEIEHSLSAMQKLVGGYIQLYKPFNDDCAIVCNEEGKQNGLPLNRAIYSEPKNIELTYEQMKHRFRQAEKDGNHIVGYVVFTEDSFTQSYSEESRTYVISSKNKAFIEGMYGYSIYASCIDGTDNNVRLDRYMVAEHGGEDGWKVERCFIQEESKREIIDIIAGNFFICYAPIDREELQSIPSEYIAKYEEKFKYPEQFIKGINGEIVVHPYNPEIMEEIREYAMLTDEYMSLYVDESGESTRYIVNENGKYNIIVEKDSKVIKSFNSRKELCEFLKTEIEILKN